ncbi:tol-pal system protein YbgF [Thiohalophilus thiocyanatoxydans]|uniref:Cell division coordinator CpoB n=1 Tax=Thiohalophilus thiocyanatoxydans TaxID=381308 RepID=A0A4R8INA8_9GAMM|nr:tol-pal system protein YbgF [Thiohalophilus thiocyanatoxydans]TDY01674.1 tol-pal system protein YbgF [Thiohalophilus thiocyanatoxydans]
MKTFYQRGLLVLLVGVLSIPAFAQDRGDRSIEQRLERLERLVDSQGLADILMRLNSLEEEIRELRGQNEELTHTIEELKKRQRELYIDLDRRLLEVERGEARKQPDTPKRDRGEQSSSDTPERLTGESAPRSEARQSSSGDDKAVPLSVDKTEQEAYKEAFNLLRELEYDQAITAFREFLQNYPDGRYAHIARYWLGEANYAQRNFRAAIGDYKKLIAHYPDSPKVAEAMLKIGYSYNQLEEYQAARDSLEKLTADYPGTTEASQARNLLQKIRAKLSDG